MENLYHSLVFTLARAVKRLTLLLNSDLTQNYRGLIFHRCVRKSPHTMLQMCQTFTENECLL